MATNTSATSQTHNGNGSTATFAISFSFLENTEVDVTVGGVLKTLNTHYTISGSSVTFTSGNIPPSGTGNIKFQRDTNISAKKVDFADGSVLTETDLDNNSDQILFAQQEITDKVNGIEEGATADQTDAEIKTAYENNSDTNAFTDALQSKLNAIESGATADQTNAEIRAAVEAASDSNVFTDNDHTKLNNIEDNATADQTASEIKTLIASSPLDASHLAANSVDSSELVDGSVDHSHLSNDCVDGDNIQDDSINSEHFVDGSIDEAHIANNAVTNAKLADAELVTLAGMQSGTASKLASGTALTSDIADLNQIDGLQKATTITDDDTKFPTSGAIVDYVAAQLAPIGGLEAIANESSFPNTQPQSGVVISIADAGGMAVSSTGTASGQTVGGTTVNISGIATNFRGSSVAAGVRFLVVSTGAGQNYTYHKATLKEDDLVGLSGDINDFGERYRVGSSNPTTNNDAGDLFFNTTSGKLLVYNGSTSAWEETQSIGNFFISTLSPAFDGSTQNFTITNAPTSAQQILLIIEGVIQKPNSGTSTPTEGFALDSNTIKLAAAPAVGASYHAVVMGSAVSIGTPSNNTVGASQLQNGAITNAHVAANAAIDASKIANLSTDSITEGNSKAEVIGSGTANGEFKVGLQDVTSNGANATALRMYQPTDAENKLELFEDNATNTAALSIKHIYNGNGHSDVTFTTNDASRHASIQYWGNLQAVQHYIAGALKFTLGQTQSVLATTLIPSIDSTYNLGSNSVRWQNIYADTLYGDGSNLTGVSSAEIYGFNTDSNGNLIVTTTNGGVDNISGTDYDNFEDVIFAATGFTFSVNANGKLIATV